MRLLDVENIAKSVRLPDDSRLDILTAVSFTVDVGEHLAIVGRSGTGKSTLLNILGLLDSPSSGRYLLSGQEVTSASARLRARLRGDAFGFVFQQFNLLPGRSALDNVVAPLLYARGEKFHRRTKIAAGLLEQVGLGERLASTSDVLSGGEQQRVAIARALVRTPRVILADEPTGALDVETGTAVMDLLEEQCRINDTALITITHDPNVASRASRQLHLSGGVLHTEPVEVML